MEVVARDAYSRESPPSITAESQSSGEGSGNNGSFCIVKNLPAKLPVKDIIKCGNNGGEMQQQQRDAAVGSSATAKSSGEQPSNTRTANKTKPKHSAELELMMSKLSQLLGFDSNKDSARSTGTSSSSRTNSAKLLSCGATTANAGKQSMAILGSVAQNVFGSCGSPTTAASRRQQGNSNSHRHHVDVHASMSGGDISATSTEEARRQIRRMTSWNTVGTNATFGTTFSDVSILEGQGQTPDEIVIAAPQFDDDGNLIPPSQIKALQQRAASKQNGKKQRVVRFDYPPISSLRECPRPDPSTLGQLYFTEDELDQIEDDRICTYNADDVEVVAVASSLSDSKSNNSNHGDGGSASAATNPDTADGGPTVSTAAANEAGGSPEVATPDGVGNFPNYLPTPPRRKNKKKGTGFEDAITRGRGSSPASSPAASSPSRPKKQRRFPTPGPGKRNRQHHQNQAACDSSKTTNSSSEHTTGSSSIPSSHQYPATGGSAGHPPLPSVAATASSSPIAPPRKERLIKSVQIYLRERSTGC